MEIQSNNNNRMDKRMLLYYGLAYEIYGLIPKQYVFYIGKEPLNMSSAIQHDRLSFSYEIIDMRDFDYRIFLQAETPQEVILSILGDFGKTTPDRVIRQILKKLVQLSKAGRRIQKHIRQLEVLSKLRSLQQQTVDQIKDMALTYDLSTDVRFLEGKELGTEIGKELGKEEEKEQIVTQFLISLAFKTGKITLEEVSQITSTPIETVKRIWKNLG